LRNRGNLDLNAKAPHLNTCQSKNKIRSKFKITVRIRVRCRRGKSDKKQGVDKTSSSNTNLWTKCEDKDHKLDLCRDV
jgi:hypothetical protein